MSRYRDEPDDHYEMLPRSRVSMSRPNAAYSADPAPARSRMYKDSRPNWMTATLMPMPPTLAAQTKLPKEVLDQMIIGLTDNPPQLPRIGVLRKGAPRTTNAPGADLPGYFRFTSEDSAVAAQFLSTYGPTPTTLGVYLTDRHTDSVFSAWKERWVKGGLMHRCDGETAHIWRDATGHMIGMPTPCPGGCTETGRLQVILPGLLRYAYVTALTGSIWDIINLSSQLRAYESLRGDLRGIPFTLTRVLRSISTPMPNGNRAHRDVWLLSLEPTQEWVALQIEAARINALPLLAPPTAPTEDSDSSAPDDPDNDTVDTTADDLDPGWTHPDDTPLAPTAAPAPAATPPPAPVAAAPAPADPYRADVIARLRTLAGQSHRFGTPVNLDPAWLDTASGQDLIAYGIQLRAQVDTLIAKQAPRPSVPAGTATRHLVIP